MTINKTPYKAMLSKAYTSDIDDDSQGYKAILEVWCDIETTFEKEEVYAYSHKIWIWLDSKVTYKGEQMNLAAYMRLPDAIDFNEGLYVECSFLGKKISGEVKLYAPCAFGIMLAIDINKK